MSPGAPRDVEEQPADEPTDGGAAPDTGPDPGTDLGETGSAAPAHPTPRRSWPGVALRAVVVLVVAGIGYQLVVPTNPTVRHRLSLLVTTDSGSALFPGQPTTSTEEPASTAAVPAVVAAAKAHPSSTGIWLSSWKGKASKNDGLAVAMFLLPDAATAAKARSQLQPSQLGTSAFQSAGLVRTGQFTPAGIPGAAGSTYGPAKGATAPGTAALTIWQQGRAVVLSESALAQGSPEATASATSRAEAAHLDRVLPGFSLTVTRYPTTATAVWAAGTLVVLLLVAGGPVGWRRRRDRQAREREEELARTIRVGGSTIVRKRHDP